MVQTGKVTWPAQYYVFHTFISQGFFFLYQFTEIK